MTFMQCIHNYVRETNHVSWVQFWDRPLLKFMLLVMLFPLLNILYLYSYIRTVRSVCTVPHVAVFCSSLKSCFPDMLLRYFLNNSEMTPVTSIEISITFVFTLLLLLLLHYAQIIPPFFMCHWLLLCHFQFQQNLRLIHHSTSVFQSLKRFLVGLTLFSWI